MKKYIVVDVETNGPTPSTGQMVTLGAVAIDFGMTWRAEFYARIGHVGPGQEDTLEWWRKTAAASADGKLAMREAFSPDPGPISTLRQRPIDEVMIRFDQWLADLGHADLIFTSDCANFDASFVFDALHKYVGSNRFGHRALDMWSFYVGAKSLFSPFSFTDDTKQMDAELVGPFVGIEHYALDDARHNAKLLTALLREGVK
jgi:DNA polymerase III alpha subunit (gram-positive type)